MIQTTLTTTDIISLVHLSSSRRDSFPGSGPVATRLSSSRTTTFTRSTTPSAWTSVGRATSGISTQQARISTRKNLVTSLLGSRSWTRVDRRKSSAYTLWIRLMSTAKSMACQARPASPQRLSIGSQTSSICTLTMLTCATSFSCISLSPSS